MACVASIFKWVERSREVRAGGAEIAALAPAAGAHGTRPVLCTSHGRQNRHGALGVRTADGALPLIPHGANVPAEGSILLTSATKSQHKIAAELAVGSPKTIVGRLALDLDDEDGPRGCPQARLHVQIDHLGALRANLTAMETSTSSLLHADGECDPVRWAAPPTARTLPRPWRYTACRSTEPLAGVAVGPSFVRLVAQRAARPPATRAQGRRRRSSPIVHGLPSLACECQSRPRARAHGGPCAVVGAAAARATRANFGARRRRRPRRPRGGARGGAGRGGGAHRFAREFGAAAAECRRQRPRRARPRRCSRLDGAAPAAFASRRGPRFGRRRCALGGAVRAADAHDYRAHRKLGRRAAPPRPPPRRGAVVWAAAARRRRHPRRLAAAARSKAFPRVGRVRPPTARSRRRRRIRRRRRCTRAARRRRTTSCR